MGPPTELIRVLAQRFGIEVFVETGTYRGGTALWAGKHFARVVTIENSQTIYNEARHLHAQAPNIEFLFGDSRALLPRVLAELRTPAMFWLDAHWSNGATFGRDDECPLLEEIAVIDASGGGHFLFIDDARLFTSPPPAPHRAEQWPDLPAVIGALHGGGTPRYTVIHDDVIVSTPELAKPAVIEYCRRVNGEQWERAGRSAAAPIRRALRWLRQLGGE